VEQLGSELEVLAASVQSNIKNNKMDNRLARVVGIRLGSGCGKSHRLLEAPKILGAHCVYITYNLDQELDFDLGNVQVAILLRILLWIAEVPNVGCAEPQRSCKAFSVAR
jgi:hypothetical protein